MKPLESELNFYTKNGKDFLNSGEDGVREGTWHWDLKKPHFSGVNSRFWGFLGYDQQPVSELPADWKSLMDPQDLEFFRELLDKHSAEPQKYSFDIVCKFRHFEGYPVWLNFKKSTVDSPKLNPYKVVGSFSLLRAEGEDTVALKKKVDYFQNVIEASNLGTFEVDFEKEIAICNDRYAGMLGYTLEELEPWNHNTWLKLVHPEDCKVVKESYEKYINNQGIYEMEFRMKHKQGHWVWILSRAEIIEYSPQGKPRKMAGYHYDITRRKTDELLLAKFKKLLEQSNEAAQIGYWELDFDKNLIYWSKVVREIREVPADYNPSLDDALRYYLEGEDRERLTKAIEKAMQEPTKFDLQAQIKTYKGNLKWVRVIGISEFQEGKCVTLYGLMQDISDKQKMTDDLTEHNNRLINFAHIVSHNLRSHTGNISMLMELAQGEDPALMENEFFKNIKIVSDNMNETILHLNEIVEINAKVVTAMSSHNLLESIEKVIQNINSTIKESHTKIEINVPKDIEVLAVHAYLESIILNLITNAIKYKKTDSRAIIKITAGICQEFVYLEFADNGMGIDLDKYGSQLFGMYRTFHEHKEARGVGLFIIKNQIEAMGGRIEVKSSVNKGSNFTTYFKNGDY
ncbi:PAS domain S-box-containing protein [Arenibacter nanhaiticus]|uniref:histidine kinase n=1 Tax=Arenibacter nanhaiticus TaxID=558155 RepID=A0A1M6MZU0_9FLAO|nr:PAS domain-containing sensor histidine kinase [Arenibacter nanhaiticus]SHJ88863.1 PAS domain S-box-containing protein [Arenibacter nanhaiticus]